MQLSQGVSDDRGAQVSDVEGLCHVGRGIIQNNHLALAKALRAIAIALSDDLGNDVLGKILIGDRDIQISVDRLDLANGGVRLERLTQRCRDLHGRTAQGLAQLEARKRKVSHVGVGGIFQHSRNVGGVQLRVLVDLVNRRDDLCGDALFDGLHNLFSPVFLLSNY